jgi:hypothetical protein
MTAWLNVLAFIMRTMLPVAITPNHIRMFAGATNATAVVNEKDQDAIKNQSEFRSMRSDLAGLKKAPGQGSVQFGGHRPSQGGQGDTGAADGDGDDYDPLPTAPAARARAQQYLASQRALQSGHAKGDRDRESSLNSPLRGDAKHSGPTTSVLRKPPSQPPGSTPVPVASLVSEGAMTVGGPAMPTPSSSGPAGATPGR